MKTLPGGRSLAFWFLSPRERKISSSPAHLRKKMHPARGAKKGLGQVVLDAAQAESCLTGRSEEALLAALSGTWELMNSIFIAFVLAPALPSSPLNYCHRLWTFLTPFHALLRLQPEPYFLIVYRTTPVLHLRLSTVFLSLNQARHRFSLA